MRSVRLYFLAIVSFLFASAVFLYHPTIADARTCCVDGSKPETCNTCEPDKDYKNYGGCAGNPTCVQCPADHPISNNCSGGGSLNMCDLFKMTPYATLNANQTGGPYEVQVKQGAYSKIDITTTDPTVAQAVPNLWGKSGLPDLGNNYTQESKSFNVVAGNKGGTAILVAHQYATYPGYEMLYCSASMTVTVLPPPTPPPYCDINSVSVTPYPDSTNFQHTSQFKLVNTGTKTVTFGWVLDDWVDNTKDKNGAMTLAPGASQLLGMPNSCNKWQLDVGCYPKNDDKGFVVEPDPLACAPKTTISSTIQMDPSLDGKTPAQLTGFLSPVCNSPDTGKPYSNGSISATDHNGKKYPGTVGGGTYTISNLPTANNEFCIEFKPSDPNVTCTCPANCSYCSRSAPSPQDLKFYVSPIGTSWYQTMGGDIAAQATSGSSVNDPIPVTCVEPFCSPFLSKMTGTEPKSIGALISTIGSVTNLSAGSVGKNPDNRTVKLTTPLVCSENYNFFYRKYSLGLNPASDFANPGNALPPAPGKLAYYYEGASPLTISSPWSLSSGTSLVIFVNGDLHINNTVKVPQGAFLAFIVSGNIQIGADVGTTDHASTTDGQVQGVYLANGTVSVQGGQAVEKKLVAEGTFAGCAGISIKRDYKSLDNNKYPGALFLYRPDFVRNTPDRMKSSSTLWHEVAP